MSPSEHSITYGKGAFPFALSQGIEFPHMASNPAMQQTYVLFQLGTTTYAVRSEVIQQMEMIEQITPIPNALPFVEGVVFARGQVIPTIDLRRRFGMEAAPRNFKTRLIVVASQGRVVGLIVDSASEFLTIPQDALKPPPESITGLSGNYLEHIATLEDRVILIVNVDAILNYTESNLAPNAPLD